MKTLSARLYGYLANRMLSDDVHELEVEITEFRAISEKAMNRAMGSMGKNQSLQNPDDMFNALAYIHTCLEQTLKKNSKQKGTF